MCSIENGGWKQWRFQPAVQLADSDFVINSAIDVLFVIVNATGAWVSGKDGKQLGGTASKRYDEALVHFPAHPVAL